MINLLTSKTNLVAKAHKLQKELETQIDTAKYRQLEKTMKRIQKLNKQILGNL